jgi:hypothetical protein
MGYGGVVVGRPATVDGGEAGGRGGLGVVGDPRKVLLADRRHRSVPYSDVHALMPGFVE